MTLKVSGSKITIQKPDGTSMFTSDDKLVYKKYSATGSANVGGTYAATSDQTLTNLAFDSAKDFAMIYIKPTAANGNVSKNLVDSTMQLNFVLLTQFDHQTNAVVISSYDLLSATLMKSGSTTFLRINHQAGKWVNYYNASTYVSLDWKVVVLSYR